MLLKASHLPPAPLQAEGNKSAKAVAASIQRLRSTACELLFFGKYDEVLAVNGANSLRHTSSVWFCCSPPCRGS